MKYLIKSVTGETPKPLENLLNEMSDAGWDLYSMHEIEADEGIQYNCIFTKDSSIEEEEKKEEIINISTFKSQMEKMLTSTLSPYESCKEIQEKIKEQRKKIADIKVQLEAQSETPVSKNRKDLNEQISKGLKELEVLRQNLIDVISPDTMYSKIRQDKLAIQMSEEALEMVNPDSGAPLISETVKIRQKITEELGYVIPKVVFDDNEKLSAFEFCIKIRGIEVVNSFAYPNYLMFFEDDLKLGKKAKSAIYSIDEITGKKIVWLEEKKTKDFWQKGFTPSEFAARLLEHMVIKYIDELFDYADVNQYMEIVSKDNMFLIENIIPDFVSISELRYLLVNLLRERISIKDIIYIFEKINDFSDEATKEDLFDKLRLSLSRYLSNRLANSDGVIQVFELSDNLYKDLFSTLDSDNNIVRVDGAKVEKVSNSLLRKAKKFNFDIDNVIVLAPLNVRHVFFMIMSQFISEIKVISREEISSGYTIEVLDEI